MLAERSVGKGAGRLFGLRRRGSVRTPPSRSLVGRTLASQSPREPWDVGRFVKTVLFFNDPVKTILQMFQRPTKEPPQVVQKERTREATKIFGPTDTAAGPVVLFGGDSELGRTFLEASSKKGLFETMEHSAQSTLEVMEWSEDAAMPARLQNSVAVVICGSLSPYARNMQSILECERDVYDPSEGIERMIWGPLDDVVMGGCSQSQLTIQQGKGETTDYAAVFSGNITSANSGGFASVRTKNFEPVMDLSAYDGLKLRLKGDGQRYKFMLRTTTDWDSVSFCQSFDTKQGWQDVKLPFQDFFGVFRAKSVVPPPALDKEQICSMQVMLSKFEYDGDLNPSVKMGRFELRIEKIAAYKDTTQIPRVVLIGGSEDDQTTVKGMTEKYTIINPSPTEEVPLKDSTFVAFCAACLGEDAAVGATFAEASRASPAEVATFEELLQNFAKA